MKKRSRRYRNNAQRLNAEQRYEVVDALRVLKGVQGAKFNETVEVAIRLGIDPKKSEQVVRGVAKLPHGTGNKVRVLVFAVGEKAQQARTAGADFVGGEELIEQIKGGWLEFDSAVATPDMMQKVGAIAKILGPRGLMPNPKIGTVTQDVAKAVEELKAGRVEFRVDKAAIVHAPVGKIAFSEEQLAENISVLIDQVMKQKPATAKGQYFKGMAISSTMGPGLKIDATRIQATGGAKA